MRELGYDVYIENQKGFVFPKGTPKAIAQKLHDSLRKVFDGPQFKPSRYYTQQRPLTAAALKEAEGYRSQSPK